MFCTYRSERVGKTNVGGTLLTEAKYINLSLHYLEQVNASRNFENKGMYELTNERGKDVT